MIASGVVVGLDPLRRSRGARTLTLSTHWESVCRRKRIYLCLRDSSLVDPASSYMLVSKIKPCMCKYELIRTVKLRMAH